uniref:S-acyltransferase n=1 Tax=Chlamydomonas leiostraca TaxID=1034604 RepID=A0A7S0X0I2_9CHLO|mmetsp:Transcript_6772/g.16863  ORF Transcript_6772/g.16863 Transcript_6772/m.16863 type:complete len:319 (+) Transcript_6772:76-1032(+)
MKWCCNADRILTSAFKLLDRVIKVLEPFYAALAAVLVLLDAYVFFTTVIAQVRVSEGPWWTALHIGIGAWLLFNVAWNHALCIFTHPGCTAHVELQDLHAAMRALPHEWRTCRKCNRPKPPLAHHCSICNQCVLRMDHHCPWMANCVGHYNYKYFFLYLFYMWAGSAYSAAMSWRHVPSLFALADSGGLTDSGFLPFLTFLLACSVFLALAVLLGWHVVLVVSGQGTIDALATYTAKDARDASVRTVNPYHLGAARNWQETFDVAGPLWWLTWALPTWRRKRGNGYAMPRVAPPAGGHHSSFHQHYYHHVHQQGQELV